MKMAHSGESFKNWDPMRDAFEDPNFNTYKEGPGAYLDLDKQPCSTGSSQKSSGTCRLFVGNIPADISKQGIENIFRSCGQPLSVYRRTPTGTANKVWAFVTFASFREAESAMRELNRKPPTYLTIEFAKGSEPVQEVKLNMHENRDEFGVKPQDTSVPRKSLSRNPGSSGLGRGLAVTPYVDPRVTDSRTTEELFNIRKFQSYGGSNFDESNAALMRGVQRVNGPEGPKKYVNGRSSFDHDMYQYCKPQKLGNIVPNVHEVKRLLENYMIKRNGFVESGEREIPERNVVGTCTRCGNEARSYCARCVDWYCSRTCQESDWQRHKKYCVLRSRRDKDMQFDDAMIQENKEEKYSSLQQERNNFYSQQQDKHDRGFRDDYQPKKMSPKNSNYQKEKNTYHSHIGNHSHDKETETIVHKKDKFEGAGHERSQVQQFKGHKKSPPKPKIDARFQNKSKREGGKSQKRVEGNNSSSEEAGNASYQPKHVSPRDRPTQLPETNHSRQSTANNAKKSNSRDHSKQVSQDNQQSLGYDSEQSVLHKISEQSSSADLSHGKLKKCEDKINSATNLKGHSNGTNSELFHEFKQLSTIAYTKVKIQIAVGPDEYWVQLCSNIREIYSMSLEMEKYKDSHGVDISVGMYCMAKYEGVWYRAKIISVKPKIRVQFVDFGNEEYAISEELKLLPACVKNMKSQAIRIRLASGTSKKFHGMVPDTDLSVKSVAVLENGITTVHVEGETYESSLSEKQSAMKIDMTGTDQEIALQNVTVLLKPNLKCYLFVIEYEDGQDFIASLVPSNLINLYNSLFDGKLNDECEKKMPVNFVPEVGEAVLAKSVSEGWIRGYVVHVSPKREFTIASCDTGLVETVKVVRKLPQNLREIAQFAVEGRVIDNVEQVREHISELKNINVIIESTSCDFAIGKVENELGDTLCKLELKKWTVPFELYQELKCVELKEGECVISAEMSAVEMYIRPMNMTCIEIYNRIMQEVPRHCFKAPMKKHTPKVGQILAAKFSEDGNFYRAVVREIHKSKGIKVQYIDFGNVEYVSQDGLKLLPKELCDIECSVVKVLLKDVEDRPLNEDVQNFFKDLIAGCVKLRVKLPDPNSNKVDLYTKDGTHVNGKINEMLVPGWKKGLTDSCIYTLANVLVEELEIGSTVELVIKLVVKFNAIVVRWQESQVANVLENDLQTTIDEYCLQTKEPYTPREMELCLAKIDSIWQRCLCVGGGNPLDLYQLDVGRIINASHQNIRRYRQEFSALPAVATWCEIITKVEATRSIQECITKYLTTMKVITAKIVQIKEAPTRLKGYVIMIPELDEYLQTVT